MTDNQEGPSPPAVVRLTAEQCAVCHCGGRDGKVPTCVTAGRILSLPHRGWRGQYLGLGLDLGCRQTGLCSLAPASVCVAWIRWHGWACLPRLGTPGCIEACGAGSTIGQRGEYEREVRAFFVSRTSAEGGCADGMGPECDIFKVACSLIQRLRVCGRCVHRRIRVGMCFGVAPRVIQVRQTTSEVVSLPPFVCTLVNRS
ncbi:hypothetical protein EDB80DRAFT_18686 [Ilyonectria destructans]|nr:hypothetical protein EDB80DRAFT_18686 [Ilyonectria destructans]